MVLYISISDGKNEELPDNVFVRFKSSQCIHCIHSQPDWDKTVKHISKKYNDSMAGLVEVEAGNEHLTGLKDKDGNSFVVKGYPTYAIFKNGVLDSIYTDERTFQSLTKAIIENLNLKQKQQSKKKKIKKIKTKKIPIIKHKKIKHEMPSFHIYPTEIEPEIITSKNKIESPKELDDEISSIKSKRKIKEEENKNLLEDLEKMELEEENEIIDDILEESDDIALEEMKEPTEPITSENMSPIVKPFMKPFDESEKLYDEEELKRRTNNILRKLQDKIKFMIDEEQTKEKKQSSKTDLSLYDNPTLQLKNINNQYKIEPLEENTDSSSDNSNLDKITIDTDTSIDNLAKLGGKTKRKRSKKHKKNKKNKHTRKHKKTKKH
jgi:hypothetical protein